MCSAYSIGLSKRSTEWKNNSHYVPGPGSYEPTKSQKYTPPSWKIGQSVRNTFLKNMVPGPGSYEIPEKIVIKTKKKYFTSFYVDSRRS